MRKLSNSELDRLSVEQFRGSNKTPLTVVLDNVRSLSNIGSVFRTSDAFLVEAIYLCGITATPPNKDIHKTALGATDSVAWEYFAKTETAIEHLKAEGYTLFAIEQAENSISLADVALAPNTKYAIVLGHEVKGVSQTVVDMCDHCIEIPQYGTKHSLNVSVSAGIVIWQLFGKLQAL